PELDDELYAICPDCEERVHCGPPGVQNMLKNHSNKGPCLATQAAKKPGKKPLKNGQISNWLRPKAPSVPSTVAAPPLIHPATIPSHQTLAPLASAPAPPSTPMSNLPRSLLEQLQAAIDILPVTVPEATEDDTLAAFGRDPSQHIDSEIPAVEIYEHLNPLFHTALGWNLTVEATAQVLRRGRWGLDGVLRFMQYFVHQRGVREQDFAAKIGQILDAIKFL
ncbi:hypothetical protein C8R46DRAFT_920645, partial [Mycena filopes]